jgi:hypothetical protein
VDSDLAAGGCGIDGFLETLEPDVTSIKCGRERPRRSSFQRVSMLALADELQSISRACKVGGISRSHFVRE